MSLVKKKKWYLDYLLIIAGTGLMALSINSVFDATGLVTGGFSGIAILVNCIWRYPAVANQYHTEHPAVFPGMQDQGLFFCKKGSGRRDLPVNLACHSASVEYSGR